MALILVSFDVADGKQPQFKEMLEGFDFKDTLGEGQNIEFLPESTMVRTKHANLSNLEHEIMKTAKSKQIEIKRMVLFGGEPSGISLQGTKLKTKE